MAVADHTNCGMWNNKVLVRRSGLDVGVGLQKLNLFDLDTEGLYG